MKAPGRAEALGLRPGHRYNREIGSFYVGYKVSFFETIIARTLPYKLLCKIIIN